MVGERGGTTATLEAGIALVEEHKASLAQSIREDILAWLSQYPSWHRDNLRIEIPADSKNALGAVVNGLIRSGVIEETGERRASSDPASHRRKSSVYRLTEPRTASFPRAVQAGTDEPGETQETGQVGGAHNSLASPTYRLFEIDENHYGQEAA